MKKYLVNNETGLIRAGWRILIFVLLFFAITTVGMITVRWILGGLPKLSPQQWTVILVTATTAVFIARKYLDKKSFVSLGLRVDRFTLLDVLSGIVNSALVMATMFFLLFSLGLLEFHGFSWWTDSVGPDVVFTVAVLPIVLRVFYELTIVAWWEELVFRGYVLQNLIAGTSLVWATIISSLAFGLIHIMNPDGTVMGGILIVLITPQLVYAYLKTGQLWLPMGLHLGWNFFQASIFGFPSSGNVSASMISQSPVGPEWLSGGKFGAEGSILIIPVTILSYFVIHYWVRLTRKPGQRFFEFTAKV
ncbi:MAG: CPBP family intramembrane glutamic endopeptidase [Woeseiaceae bacterium]